MERKSALNKQRAVARNFYHVTMLVMVIPMRMCIPHVYMKIALQKMNRKLFDKTQIHIAHFATFKVLEKNQ